MMEIITFYENSYKPLYDLFFYPTYELYLQKSFHLNNMHQDYFAKSHFQSEDWCSFIIKRFDFLIEYVSKNKDSWAIFSDVDIIFFDDIYKNISEIVKSSTKKCIYYMPENHYSFLINGGFFLFKCNSVILQWFKLIKQWLKNSDKPNDQTFINLYLQKTKPDFVGLLDKEIFSCNNAEPYEISKLIKQNKLKVFHATHSYSILEKINILSSANLVNNYTKNGNPLFLSNFWNLRHIYKEISYNPNL